MADELGRPQDVLRVWSVEAMCSAAADGLPYTGRGKSRAEAIADWFEQSAERLGFDVRTREQLRRWR